MLYSEKMKDFQSAHKYESTVVDGARYRYILCGKESGKTLVFLNGGMNTLEMWMDYVDTLDADARVLLFDYPQELATNQALVAGMHAFFAALGIEKPISATRATAAWSRRYTRRNTPTRSAVWCWSPRAAWMSGR